MVKVRQKQRLKKSVIGGAIASLLFGAAWYAMFKPVFLAAFGVPDSWLTAIVSIMLLALVSLIPLGIFSWQVQGRTRRGSAFAAAVAKQEALEKQW